MRSQISLFVRSREREFDAEQQAVLEDETALEGLKGRVAEWSIDLDQSGLSAELNLIKIGLDFLGQFISLRDEIQQFLDGMVAGTKDLLVSKLSGAGKDIIEKKRRARIEKERDAARVANGRAVADARARITELKIAIRLKKEEIKQYDEFIPDGILAPILYSLARALTEDKRRHMLERELREIHYGLHKAERSLQTALAAQEREEAAFAAMLE